MAQPLLKNANFSAFKQQLICSLEKVFYVNNVPKHSF